MNEEKAYLKHKHVVLWKLKSHMHLKTYTSGLPILLKISDVLKSVSVGI